MRATVSVADFSVPVGTRWRPLITSPDSLFTTRFATVSYSVGTVTRPDALGSAWGEGEVEAWGLRDSGWGSLRAP